MRLYLVRHGQTVANHSLVHQRNDDPLSDLGKKQIDALANRFEHIAVDLVISSDYMRAKQTAEKIVEVKHTELILSELLRERTRPSVLHGQSFESKEAKDVIKLIVENQEDKDWRHSDEENFYDVLGRVKQFLEMVGQRRETNIVVVSHAAYMKHMLTYMLFGEKTTSAHFHQIYDFFQISNAGISVVERQKSFHDREKDMWRCLQWNDSAHLG